MPHCTRYPTKRNGKTKLQAIHLQGSQMAVPRHIRPVSYTHLKELQQSISFSVISPSFIRFAARINSGTANSVKLFRPLNIFWNTTKFGICPRDAIPVKDTTPSANEIGTPMATDVYKRQHLRCPQGH